MRRSTRDEERRAKNRPGEPQADRPDDERFGVDGYGESSVSFSAIPRRGSPAGIPR